MNKQQALNFTIGLFSGAVVGVATATLLAPNSGTDSRQLIQDKIKEIIDTGKLARVERKQALQTEYQEAIRIPLPIDTDSAS